MPLARYRRLHKRRALLIPMMPAEDYCGSTHSSVDLLGTEIDLLTASVQTTFATRSLVQRTAAASPKSSPWYGKTGFRWNKVQITRA